MPDPPALPSRSMQAQCASSQAASFGSPTASERAFAEHILATIGNLTQRCGRPPTYREVLTELELRSHRRLSIALDALVASGRLHRLAGSRNLIVVPDSQATEHE